MPNIAANRRTREIRTEKANAKKSAVMKAAHDDLKAETMKARDEADLRLRHMADSIFAQHLQVISDASEFRNIDPSLPEPPAEWVEELGYEEAQNRFRIARAAWLPLKDAPVGLKISQQIVTGIMKAKATEKGGPRTLNVIAVQMTTPTLQGAPLDQTFPTLDMDVEK
jgi:hypothetical protein